jgi:[ribosomal protein S5]-alanine N-acetyltransferase
VNGSNGAAAKQFNVPHLPNAVCSTSAKGKPPLTSLTLRLLCEGDVDTVFPIWSDAEVVRFTNWPLISNIVDCAARVDRILYRYKEGSLRIGPFCIVGDNSRVLGIAGFDVREPFDGQHELWYLFRRDSWGKGIGARSIAALLNTIESVPRVSKIVATAVASNTASWKILEKCAFKRSGTQADGFDRAGFKSDIFEYERKLGTGPDQSRDPPA